MVTIQINPSKDGYDVVFLGSLLTNDIPSIDQQLSDFFSSLPQKTKKISFDLMQLSEMDTGGVWFLIKTYKQKHEISLQATELQHKQIDYIQNLDIKQSSIDRKMSDGFLSDVGHKAEEVWQNAKELLGFFGEVTMFFVHYFTKHKKSTIKMRWISIGHHIEMVGIHALMIIGLTSILIGSVLAYQSINQLSRFGAEIYTVDFLIISLLREISVLLTSIVVAGRSGSAFTAQIGTMSLNQEIDALKVLGLNPLEILVVPRMIALLIVLPLLVFFSMIMGLIGGMVIIKLIIGMSPDQFWQACRAAVSGSTIWVGLSKAPLFAILISLVGCYRGLQVSGSAESVGKMTTQSVVESIFLVIVCDALMSLFFSALDL